MIDQLKEIVVREVRQSESADVDSVLARVLPRVTREMTESIVIPHLQRIIKETASEERRRGIEQAQQDAQPDGPWARAAAHTANRRRQGRQAAADTARRTAIEIERKRKADGFFNVWKETVTGPKFLGDCTASDFLYSRDQLRSRSDILLKAAERDQLLANHLKNSGYGTLREMGYDLAIKAFSGKPQLMEDVA